ncbi:HNH endonuclease [Microbacterium phage ASegato]|nr:HNH endonuclease [Microbacterium phage ASegato]
MNTCEREDCEKEPAPGRQGRCSTHYWRDYRASRRDELNANYKAWAAKRGPRRALMTPEQKLADRLWNAARRARRLGATVYEITPRDIQRLERRQGGKCAYCDKASAATLHLEHVVPLVYGGSHGVGNIVLACEDCNKAKGVAFLTEWHRPTPKGKWDQEPF